MQQLNETLESHRSSPDARALGGIAASGAGRPALDTPPRRPYAWYAPFTADGIEAVPDFPPADFPLPAHITGEDLQDIFNTKALPRLREAFPAYYTSEKERVQRARQVDPEIEIELTRREAFESLALQLRCIIDAGNEAARDGDEVLMTFDNDKVLSRKPDTSLRLGLLATHDAGWEALSDVQQRSAYHRLIARDVEATVISPAVIIGVNVLKEAYGKRFHFGMVTSNVQEYLDMLCARLNALTHDAFEPNYVIAYGDGRFASDMEQEQHMTRGDNRADPKASPTLRAVFSTDVSYVYADAARYIDFDNSEAGSVSSQDLKPGILLRLKDEDPYRRLSVVHIDDMPSAMRANVPGARYVQLPHAAWFMLIENRLF